MLSNQGESYQQFNWAHKDQLLLSCGVNIYQVLTQQLRELDKSVDKENKFLPRLGADEKRE